MDILPSELKLRILSFLTEDFETIEALKKVNSNDPVIEVSSQAYQAIVIDSGTGSYPSVLPSDHVHNVEKVLAKDDLYFKLPVDQLWVFMSSIKSENGYEEGLKLIHRVLAKEPQLARARRLKICGDYADYHVTSRHRYNWDDVRLHTSTLEQAIFFDFDLSKRTTSKQVTRFPRLEKLEIEGITLAEVPVLTRLKELKMPVGGNSSLENLNKLCHLVKLSLVQGSSTILDEYGGRPFKLPELKYLELRYDTWLEDNFDEYLPRLKTLDISFNSIDDVPEFSKTSLEELHISLEQISYIENLSTLINLRKLYITAEDDRFPDDDELIHYHEPLIVVGGISQLLKLEFLELTKGDNNETTSELILDHNLPKNLRELSILYYGIYEIKCLPATLQKLQLISCDLSKVENLNSDLSILELTGTYVSEINCDMTQLTMFNTHNESFKFNDKSTFQQQYKKFNDYCHRTGTKYKYYDEYKDHI